MEPSAHDNRRQLPRPEPPPPTGLLDVEAVAVRLGSTVRFVRRLVAERRIPFAKVGKFARFDPDEVEQRINDHRVGERSGPALPGADREHERLNRR